jgi:hypothetical protein
MRRLDAILAAVRCELSQCRLDGIIQILADGAFHGSLHAHIVRGQC